VFADFIRRGELDRHLRRMRAHYRVKRDLLVAALGEHLPGCRICGIAAGLHLVLELARGANEAAVVEAVAQSSVGVSAIGRYRARFRRPPALILGYGSMAERDIVPGVVRLADAIERLRTRF
jgi:GntR family transcriptional regulator/MocR family aminotransferase